MSNKIQVRRGVRTDLPNPLDNGELGWCEDTRELYIGTGVANSNLKVAGAAVTSDFTIYGATAALGGRAVSDGATGSELASGVTTGSAAGKLENGNADFTPELAGRTVYNSTDDTWAKVDAVDSPTVLSLSADIMAAGEEYVIADALDTLPEAFAAVPGPFSANVTVRVSPGTFPEDVTFVGKTASGDKTLTVRGSTTGVTTVSGRVIHRQKLAMRDITFAGKVSTYFGADLEWYGCATSGASRLYIYSGSANYVEGSTVTVGNDPTGIIAVNSTVNKGYAMYVASTVLGGDDAVADGLAVTNGTATATSTGKLVDSSSAFTAALAGLTVYNATDETWAKVVAVDSPTQLSLSADIMASGEEYVVANAFSTIQSAVDAVPGTVNCDTTIKVSAETHSGDVTIQGKAFSGTYTLGVEGCYATEDNATATGGSQGDADNHGAVSDSGSSWTTDQFLGMWLVFDDDTPTAALQGRTYLIQSNTATQITIVGIFDAAPVSGDTFRVYSSSSTLSGVNTVKAGQLSVEWRNLNLAHQQQLVTDGSSATFRQCDMPGFRAKTSSIYAYNCHIHGQGWGHRNVWANVAAYAFISRCIVCDDSGSVVNACVYVDGGSTFVNGNTTSVIDGKGTKPEAVRVEINSNAFFWKPAGDTKLEINNATTGLYAWKGSQASYTDPASYVAFSGCTTDRSADATSYGYYSDS